MKRYNCPTTMKTIDRNVERQAREAISVCCAAPEFPVDFDGIPSRHPTALESATALLEVTERGETLLDVDDSEYNPYDWMD